MRIRYRLRSLILLVTLIAIILGVCVARYNSYRDKVASITELNAFPQIQYALTRADLRSGYYEPTEKPRWWEWIAGDFPSLDVVVVGIGLLSEQGSTMPELSSSLGRFPTVTELVVLGSDAADSDICVLPTHFPNVSRLVVTDVSDLTDESITCVARFRELRRLETSYTQFTGLGFREVAKSCGKLEYLDLSDACLTDQGLEEIAACRSLKELNISYNSLSPSALTVLSTGNIQQLRRLVVAGISADYSDREREEYRKAIDSVKSRFPDLDVSY